MNRRPLLLPLKLDIFDQQFVLFSTIESTMETNFIALFVVAFATKYFYSSFFSMQFLSYGYNL